MDKEISANLDMDSLTLDDNSYQTPENEKLEADVVYDCLWKGQLPVKVSLLFEHKSSYPELLALQLLRYMLEIWEKQYEQKKPFTVVIPIVLYHGEKGFTYKPLGSLFGEIKDPKLRKFIPDFQALIINLAKYEDDDLLMMQLGLLYAMAVLFKHKRDWNYLLEHSTMVFSYVQENYDEHTIQRYSKSLFTYLWAVNKPDKTTWSYLVKKVPSKIKDMAETMYQHVIEEGKEIGKQIGLSQGLSQGQELKARKVIVKLDSQFPQLTDQQVASIVDMPVAFVKKVRSEIRKQRKKDMN